MTRTILVALALAGAFASPAALLIASPPRTLARAIAAESSKPGSIEDALHIRKASGTFELNEKARSVSLRLDLYRGGNKVKTFEDRQSSVPGLLTTSGSFAVQVIDLDYLRLGEPKPGHLRIVTTLTLNGMSSTHTDDVPKDLFGGEGSSGFQPFRPQVGTPAEAPLFHMILATRPDAAGGRGIHGGSTVEEVVRMNAANDVMVATLVALPGGE